MPHSIDTAETARDSIDAANQHARSASHPKLLAVLMPFAIAISFAMVFIVHSEPDSPPALLAGFGGAAVVLLLTTLGLARNWLSVRVAGTVTGVIIVALLALRAVSLFTADAYQAADSNVMHSLYAYLPLSFILFAISLPYAMGARCIVLAWLGFSGLCTTLLFALPGPVITHVGAGPLLLLLWGGYAVFVVVVIGVWRWQIDLVQRLGEETAAALSAQWEADRSANDFQVIFNQAAVGMAILDQHGNWLSVNDQMTRITGYTRDELRRHNALEITHPDDVPADLQHIKRIVNREIDSYQRVKRYLHKNGNEVWVQASVSRIDGPQQEADRFVSVIDDISERVENEAELQSLRESLEVRIADRTQALERVQAQLSTHNHKLGVVTEILGMLPSAKDQAEACQLVVKQITRVLPGTSGVIYLRDSDGHEYVRSAAWGDQQCCGARMEQFDCWAVRRGRFFESRPEADALACAHFGPLDGDARLGCQPMIASGRMLGVISVRWDEASSEAQQQLDTQLLHTIADQLAMALVNAALRTRLRRRAERDPLTKLLNRSTVDERFGQAIAQARRSNTRAGVILLDLDRFKHINDTFGHDMGDEVLAEVGAALQRTRRESDTVFRMGGEEFVVLLHDTSAEGARRTAARIREALADIELNQAGVPIPTVTASIGVALFPEHGATTRALLAAADRAMYAVKHAGRDGVRIAGEPGSEPPPSRKVTSLPQR